VVGVWDLTPGVNEGEPEEDGSERKKKRRKQAPGVVIAKVRSVIGLRGTRV
jgi:ribosome biogenesis protein YTM1